MNIQYITIVYCYFTATSLLFTCAGGGGCGDYESDFEDYSPVDDQDTINQKCKILNNMQDLEKSRGKLGTTEDMSIAQVRQYLRVKKLRQACGWSRPRKVI